MWHRLVLLDSVLYQKINILHLQTRNCSLLLIVASTSLHKISLNIAHDTSGHQGTDKTLGRLSDFTYWVGDVGYHCTCCVSCQMAKAPATPPAPLQSIVTSSPWEIVEVDILKVPMSTTGNSYLLVAQGYFSEWPFAIELLDQKATTVVRAL